MRPSDWNFGASVQHELIPRVSIDVGYVRRVFHGFNVTDNLAVGPCVLHPVLLSPHLRTRACPAVVDIRSAASTTSTRRPSARPTTTLPPRRRYGNHARVLQRAPSPQTPGFRGLQSRADSTSAGPPCRPEPPAARNRTARPVLPRGHRRPRNYKGLATYTIPKVEMQLGLTFLSKPGMVVSFAGTPTNGGHLRAKLHGPQFRDCAHHRPAAVGRRGQRHGEPHRARDQVW